MTLLRRFGRSTDGAMAAIFAVSLVTVFTAIGLAVDYSSLIKAKAVLQDSLDAGMLGSARMGFGAEEVRRETFNSIFDGNVANNGVMYNVTRELIFEEGINFASATAVAEADVRLYFPFVLGKDRHIRVSSGAKEVISNLEIVTVLDNTGSMAAGGRIQNLRVAADRLFESLKDAKLRWPRRDIKGALVPFVTAVNVNGDQFDPAWIDMAGNATYNGVHLPALNGKKVNHIDLFRQLESLKPEDQRAGWNKTGWKGCVEARPGDLATSDARPDPGNADTLFVPYFAPDDVGGAVDKARISLAAGGYGNQANAANNSYLDDQADVPKLRTRPNLLGIDLLGILQSLLSMLGLSEDQNAVLKYIASTKTVISEGPQMALPDLSMLEVGPNRSCPTPIIPLTSDFEKLKEGAREMVGWRGSGTNVAEGLSWGMRVLSPQAPYAGGEPWKSANTDKVVVLLTDGENQTYGNPPGSGSDYGSYGFLNDNRLGTKNSGEFKKRIDERLLNVCTQLKEQKVRLITIVLMADNASNRKLYSECASTKEDMHIVNDPSLLPDLFGSIVGTVAPLQLTN